jgi:hypothetical protein
MTIDPTHLRNVDPDRAMEAFIKPIETPTLSTRLRAAADDIAFQGRPDPHDDKKLLREAARELETSATRRAHFGRLADRYASESAHMFRLLHAIAALDPDDTKMSKVEFRGKVRELAQQRMDPGVGAQPGDQWTELDSLRTSVAAQREHHHELGQYIVAVHKPGLVDEAAVAILDGYHVGATQVAGGGAGEPGEHTLAAALRLLKLAHERGAFSAFFPAHTVLQPLGDCLNALMADPELDLECFPLKPDGSRQLEGEGGIEMAVRLLKLAASRGAYARGEHIQTEQGPMLLACTGDVDPGAEAVDTRFLELFYLSGPRVGLRFEGLPDVYVPDADAHAIAATLLAGGELAAPSWKLITRAAEYFGQRVHVDGVAGKLVLTDSSTYYKAGPGRSRAELAQDIRAAVGKLRALTLLPEDARLVTEIAGQLEAFAAAMSPVREDTSDVDPSPTGQARRALQRLGPTVAGVGGSIKLAAAIGIGPACGLSIDEFRPLLAAWNEAGTPRWTDEAIEVRLRDRYEQHKADFFADIPTTGPTSSEPEQDPAARLLPRPA